MNFDEIVVKESPGICRCCLSEGCYKDLGTEYTWMNETEVYADMLLDCFDISITQHNDGPNGAKRLICEVCITRLRDACNFKKQVVDSERRFIDMLGRGEFKTKVLTYQSSRELKEEAADETPEDVMAEDVEYLEDVDIDYDGEEEEIKTELLQSTSAASSSERPRLKRGRPRKVDDKPDKAKKQKVAKDLDIVKVTPRSSARRKDNLVRLLTIIIENSTVMPFRWSCNKYMCFYCCCPFLSSVQLKQHNADEHTDTKIRGAFRSLLRNSKIKLEISEIKCTLCLQQFTKLDHLIDHFVDMHDFKIDHSLKTELFPFRLSEEKMVCEDCGAEFQFFATLLKHFHSFHNKNEPHICEICGMGFVAKANVQSHVKNVHFKDVSCDKCDDKNCEHLKKPTDKKCPMCSEVLPSPYMYKRHLANVHDVKTHQFPCDLCPKVFPVRYRLVKHKHMVHLKQRSFGCEMCGYRAFSKEYLRRHMVCHDDARPFECDFCKKTFQRKKTLEFHRRIHTNDKRCVCKVCGKAFVQTTSLKLHYRVHHPKDGSKDADWT